MNTTVMNAIVSDMQVTSHFNSKPIVFLFSGQGSHYYQMGKKLFDKNPIFRKWMFTLDDLVFENIGESVLDVLYDEKKRRDEKFDRLLYTHPAIFMIEFALAQVLLDSGIVPDYVLGASLGEFASAALAGVTRVEELLKSVLKQVECLEAHCEEGGMLAVIHNASLYNESPCIYENSELSSINYDSHFVVSGLPTGLKRIERFLKTKNILSQPLPVSYGFHSSLIDSAESEFTNYLSHESYHVPQVAFVSSVFGSMLRRIPENYFWDVVRKPVEFSKAIRTLEHRQNHIYLDLGPCGTLANFAKYNLSNDSQSETYAIITPFQQELKNLEYVKGLIEYNIQ